jgi:DNA integrity scanning protein DisA with diadenylate cyclase activity
VALYNKDLWQTVTFLFLSKFVKQANVPFVQEELINTKNIELASRFAKMVGDTTEEKKIKFALLKALRQFEKEELVLRLSEATLQLSDEGFAKMKMEVETAMLKIAQSFPESTPKDQPTPTVQ